MTIARQLLFGLVHQGFYTSSARLANAVFDGDKANRPSAISKVIPANHLPGREERHLPTDLTFMYI